MADIQGKKISELASLERDSINNTWFVGAKNNSNYKISYENLRDKISTDADLTSLLQIDGILTNIGALAAKTAGILLSVAGLSDAIDNIDHFTLEPAKADELGGIKIGFPTDADERKYAVQLDETNKAFVEVHWISPGNIDDVSAKVDVLTGLSGYYALINADGSKTDLVGVNTSNIAVLSTRYNILEKIIYDGVGNSLSALSELARFKDELISNGLSGGLVYDLSTDLCSLEISCAGMSSIVNSICADLSTGLTSLRTTANEISTGMFVSQQYSKNVLLTAVQSTVVQTDILKDNYIALQILSANKMNNIDIQHTNIELRNSESDVKQFAIFELSNTLNFDTDADLEFSVLYVKCGQSV